MVCTRLIIFIAPKHENFRDMSGRPFGEQEEGEKSLVAQRTPLEPAYVGYNMSARARTSCTVNAVGPTDRTA
jgi:hypothetical protein